jgi:hypothetical protein
LAGVIVSLCTKAPKEEVVALYDSVNNSKEDVVDVA